MHIVFIIVAGVIGLWVSQNRWISFGWIAGMLIGSLLWRLSDANRRIDRLGQRVDNLEMRPTQEAAIAKAEIKAPARVSIYEPEPEPEPESEIKTPDLPIAPAAPESVPIVPEEVPESPPPPGIGEHSIAVAKRWLTTGNVAVKGGVIISFFGVAFLLKYAVDNQVLQIPIGVRYLGVAAFAAILLALGWRMRSTDRTYALSLQGGVVGVLYLVVFAALRVHELLPPSLAFAFLVLITAAAGYLAIVQESRAFAILGTTGGFVAPLLISTGVGDHVALFGYYLVLNCAVLGIAWYRAWRELNIIGFVFTFGVGTLWGFQYYTPDKFASIEPFLVAYFLFYTAIAVLFAFRQKPELRGYVDGSLLFGTPTIAFALQSQLVNDTEYGLSISAAVVAAFYALTALWLRQKREENFDLLRRSFIALSVAFGTVAIPLALDDRWTAIAWVMEGAALIWIGVRQSGTLPKMSGTVLAFAGGLAFLNYGWTNDLGIPVLNGNFIGGVIIALSGLYSSRMLLTDEHGNDWQKEASVALLVWGLMWWFGVGFAEIADRAPGSMQLYAGLSFFAFSFVVMNLGAKRLEWLALQRITFVFLPFAGGAALLDYGWTSDLGLPVLNGNVMGGAIVALTALYSSRMLLVNKRDRHWQELASLALLGWALLWWFGAGTLEALDRAPENTHLHFLLLFYSANFVAMTDIAHRFLWPTLSRTTQAILPMMLIMAFAYLGQLDHLFVGMWSPAWIAVIAAYVWTLYARRNEHDGNEAIMHGGGGIFLAALLAYEFHWQVDQVVSNSVWSVTAGLFVLSAAAFAYTNEKARSMWPFSENFVAYHQASAGLVATNLLLLIVACMQSPGNPSPLPYIPILNPFDILSIMGLAVAWFVSQATPVNSEWRSAAESRTLLKVLAGIAFVLSTFAVVRGVHHFAGVPWDQRALMSSVGVQSTLSIYWALLGLSGMVLGTRKASRAVWIVGAALMGIVVLKLFVIDLGNSGTLARIVSFLGVGTMLLVVGYFSPVPPKQPDRS